MKRLVLLIFVSVLLLGVAPTLRAQYYSVNIDWKTAAAMQAAYTTGAAAEGFYYEQVKDILDHYTAAEAAAAPPFVYWEMSSPGAPITQTFSRQGTSSPSP